MGLNLRGGRRLFRRCALCAAGLVVLFRLKRVPDQARQKEHRTQEKQSDQQLLDHGVKLRPLQHLTMFDLVQCVRYRTFLGNSEHLNSIENLIISSKTGSALELT